jgi:hypothetical protein
MRHDEARQRRALREREIKEASPLAIRARSEAARARKYAKKREGALKLEDWYVNAQIAKETGLSASAVPKEQTVLRRAELIRRRRARGRKAKAIKSVLAKAVADHHFQSGGKARISGPWRELNPSQRYGLRRRGVHVPLFFSGPPPGQKQTPRPLPLGPPHTKCANCLVSMGFSIRKIQRRLALGRGHIIRRLAPDSLFAVMEKRRQVRAYCAENLGAGYVRKCIMKNKPGKVPLAVINLKRAQILLHRELNKNKPTKEPTIYEQKQ